MIALLQRVNHASVKVDNAIVGEISSGLLVFIGVEKNDSQDNAKALFEKIRKFRIFADENGKLNHNIEQVQADILLVPQFTLAAETKKGNRPGFDPVAPPELADMKVLLENDGPLTFWLQK